MSFEELLEFRKILCLCPCCGEIVRVSDLRLKKKGPVALTWLDEYDQKSMALEKREERFDEKEGKLREKAREKGRLEAQKAINTLISPALRKMKLDPYDVKAILNPIDFVVFKGMNKGAVNDILFLSQAVMNKELNIIREQVKDVIAKKEYEWKVARIDEKGEMGIE